LDDTKHLRRFFKYAGYRDRRDIEKYAIQREYIMILKCCASKFGEAFSVTAVHYSHYIIDTTVDSLDKNHAFSNAENVAVNLTTGKLLPYRDKVYDYKYRSM
jgi:hypothetical protein